MAPVVDIVSLALSITGALGLSFVLLDTAVSPSCGLTLHPVFINYVGTWLLWAGWLIFCRIAGFAFNPLSPNDPAAIMGNTLKDMLWIITQISTFCFVIHLWRLLKTALTGTNAMRVVNRKSHIFTLLIAPYVLGLIPLAQLFYPSGTIFGVSIRTSIGIAFIVLSVLTLLFDVSLLIFFWRSKKKYQKTEIGSYMTLTLHIKLTLFCSIRVIISTICAIFVFDPHPFSTALVEIGESSYPLLIFLVCTLKMIRCPVEMFRNWLQELAGERENIPDQNGPRRPSKASITIIDIGPISLSRRGSEAV
ncbi:hypothetical protein M422DRAFT_241065 [Sphaerobolus stellatus SS14]|nr:hypothetical protein M422DRAFT_241065 [Sphaerobolus stellatus SS14]